MSFFNWIKNCFNHLIFGEIKEELITKITDNENIAPQVQEKLKESIITNDPEKLLEDLHDKTNVMSDNVRKELIESVMRASQMNVRSITTEDPKTCVETVEHQTDDAISHDESEVIHTGKIIPSDQFVPVHTNVATSVWVAPRAPEMNADRAWRREVEHDKLRQFIRDKREAKKKEILYI